MSQNQKRNYKATVILDTRGYEETVDTILDKLQSILQELGAEVSSAEHIGQIEFVRVTNPKHRVDSYLQLAFAAGPEVPASLREKIRLDRTIKRLMIYAA